jgi:hypothetical protein
MVTTLRASDKGAIRVDCQELGITDG